MNKRRKKKYDTYKLSLIMCGLNNYKELKRIERIYGKIKNTKKMSDKNCFID